MLSAGQVKQMRGRVSEESGRLANFFGALGDTGRLKIFRLLMQNEDLCVSDVANVLDISVPAASQQLKVMELSGLVERKRDGQMICYKVRRRDPAVRALMRLALINN